MASRLSVNILDTSKLQNLLGDGSSHDTGTTGRWDQLEADGASFTGGLVGHSVDLADLVSPETATYWNKVQLSDNKSALDSNLDLLGYLDAETDVSVLVSNDNNSLEASTLSGLGLLLHGDNLHDFVAESFSLRLNERVYDGCLLDRDGVGVDLLE